VRNLHIGACGIESNMAADAQPSSECVARLDRRQHWRGGHHWLHHSAQQQGPDCANIRINGAGDDPALERRTGGKFTREGNVTITGNVFSDIQLNVHITDWHAASPSRATPSGKASSTIC